MVRYWYCCDLMHDPVQILVHLTWIKVQVYILRGIFVWNDANNTPKTEGNTGFWQGVIFSLFFSNRFYHFTNCFSDIITSLLFLRGETICSVLIISFHSKYYVNDEVKVFYFVVSIFSFRFIQKKKIVLRSTGLLVVQNLRD